MQSSGNMKLTDNLEGRESTGAVGAKEIDLNDRCAKLVALLKPHVSSSVGAHTNADAVRELVERQKSAIENEEARRPRFMLNENVSVWREPSGTWFFGRVSCVNSDYTYHILSNNGDEIEAAEDNIRSVDNLAAYLPIDDSEVEVEGYVSVSMPNIVGTDGTVSTGEPTISQDDNDIGICDFTVTTATLLCEVDDDQQQRSDNSHIPEENNSLCSVSPAAPIPTFADPCAGIATCDTSSAATAAVHSDTYNETDTMAAATPTVNTILEFGRPLPQVPAYILLLKFLPYTYYYYCMQTTTDVTGQSAMQLTSFSYVRKSGGQLLSLELILSITATM